MVENNLKNYFLCQKTLDFQTTTVVARFWDVA
jgi:hypothetical protein